MFHTLKDKKLDLPLYHVIPTFHDLEKEAYIKTLWQKEKMLVTSISPPTMFSNLSRINFIFWATFILSSANSMKLDQPKILLCGNDLIPPLQVLNPLPDDKILDRSKLKQSADDKFKFDENSRKFSK